jgi:hypothetical protein
VLAGGGTSTSSVANPQRRFRTGERTIRRPASRAPPQPQPSSVPSWRRPSYTRRRTARSPRREASRHRDPIAESVTSEAPARSVAAGVPVADREDAAPG